MELLYPDLALPDARRRLVWLLDEEEADRHTQVGRRHRRRLTQTTGARTWQATRQ